MKYTDLEGAQRESEVWCPGPLFNTVWLVNGTVVKLTGSSAAQVEWNPVPPVSDRRMTPEVLEFARDILRRYWQSDPDVRKYRLKLGLKIPQERPTDEEVALAKAVVEEEERRQEAGNVYRQGHTASTPVSITRIRELSDELCSETNSSVE